MLLLSVTSCAKNPQVTSQSNVKTLVHCTGDILDGSDCNSFWDDAVESGSINTNIQAVDVEIKKFEIYDEGHYHTYAAFRVSADGLDPARGWGQYLTMEIGDHDEEEYDENGEVVLDSMGNTKVTHVAGTPITSFILIAIGTALNEESMEKFPSEIKEWLTGDKIEEKEDSFKKLKGL